MPRTDFNGDGRDDIFWVALPTNTATNWLATPDGRFSRHDAATDHTWGLIVGVGDVNGDGRSDTLWRMPNGDVTLSFTYPDGNFYFESSQDLVLNVPTDWWVVGMGDFNGDGKDDILWRSAQTGLITNWLSQGSYVFTNNHANTGLQIANDWRVVAIGDFNGDGRDDIMLRNGQGVLTDWLARPDGGFTSNQATFTAAIPTDWRVVGTGDFNGDGRGDLLWRHSSGTLTNWLGQADGTFINNHVNTGYVVAAEWEVQGTGDYNGDGRADILWRHTNGVVSNWLGQANGGFANNPGFDSMPTGWTIFPFAHADSAGAWDY